MVRLVNTSSKTIVCILVKSRGKSLIVKSLKNLKTNFYSNNGNKKSTTEIRRLENVDSEN